MAGAQHSWHVAYLRNGGMQLMQLAALTRSLENERNG